MYLRSAQWINAERELPLEHQIVVRAQLVLMHHCPRDEHCLFLTRETALEHVSLEIDDNAVLGVIRVEMRDAVTFVSLHINIYFDSIKHTDNRHGEHLLHTDEQTYRIIKV